MAAQAQAQDLVPQHTYQWKSLTSPDATRLLCLKGAKDESSPLHGTLVEVKLFGEPSYEALSYACGEYDPSVKLYCDESVYILITKTLAAALRHFRHSDTDRLLWIDCVCIHQTDIPEKNHQVGKLMHRIFHSATLVLAWLGPEDGTVARAFKIFSQLLEQGKSWADADTIIRKAGSIPKTIIHQMRDDVIPDDASLNTVSSLLDRGWFNRRWIMQEIILARDIVVHCGRHKLTWQDFATAVAIVSQIAVRKSTMRLPEGHEDTSIFNFGVGKVERAARCRLQWRSLDQDSQGCEAFYLANIIHDLGWTESRDPRDAIYALLDVSKDPFEMKVDYLEDALSTYIRLTHHYLFDLHTLSVLYYANGKRAEWSYVPAWNINTTSEEAFQFGGKLSVGRRHPLQFCAGTGLSLQRGEIRISASSKPVVAGWLMGRLGSAPVGENEGHILEFKGKGNVPELFLFYYRCVIQRQHLGKPSPYRDPIAAFAQTMITDGPIIMRDEANTSYLLMELMRETPEFFQAAQNDPQALKLAKRIDSFKETQILARGDEFVAEYERWMHTYYTALILTVSTRNFVTFGNQLIGLVPGISRPGDIACLFAGAETPFILRPVNRESRHMPNGSVGKIKYRLVGECYIHGAMHGEYIGSEEDKKWFELF